MAAMVVRSSDDKVLLSGQFGHSHFQPDKVSRIRNEDPGPQCGRSRSRKAKNGPKKQPQRGLGVAQLEKLRLQEQSKQDAACLASLGLVPLPSNYAFPTEQGGAGTVCLPHHLLSRHIKGGTFQMNTASLLSLGGNSYRSPTDRNGGFQGCDPVWGKEGESPAPHSAVPDPSLSILLSQQQESASAFHGARMAAEVSKAASVSHVVPLLSSGMERHPVHPDKNAGGLMAAIRASSRAEVESMIKQDIKAHKTGDVGGHHHFGVNCVQMFDASLPPGPLQQRDCRELSMVGIPKELSSFQTKYPGNQVWPTMHNASSQKRPCVVLQENPRVLIPLDHGEIHSSSVQSETADNILKGAHYTPRSISNALGKSSSLPFLKTDAACGAKSNISGFDNVKHCKTDPNDSMSSVSSMPFLQRKRASPTYLDSPSPKKAAGADFLSLSLSIPHTDVESKDSNQISSKSGDDSSHLQRSLSLQETVTDVEDCSQKSPSSYGNSNSVEISGGEVENSSPVPRPTSTSTSTSTTTRTSSPWQQHQMRSFSCHMTLPSKCGIQQVPNKCIPPEVDLSLKL